MRFSRIVIGIDFTDASLAATGWVAHHLAPEAELVLVHVLPEPRVPSFLRLQLPPTEEIAEGVARTLHGGLRGLADLVAGDRARIDVLAGNPADALAVVAEELGADLVCVGRGRRRRGSARFGATTSARLISRTRVPTLVVPAARPGTPARILAAVDDRPGGRRVFAAACALGAAIEAGVEALHVVEPEVLDFVRAARPADRAPHDAWVRDRTRAWLDAVLDDVRGGAPRAGSLVREGDPGQEIVRHARQQGAEMIVIGRGGDASHACVPAGALPVGSTTRLVTWAAPCPVLVLPLDAGRDPSLPPRERDARHRGGEIIELRAAPRTGTEPLPPAAWRGRPGRNGAA
jgi:nucleotide-binding universal stress UspA family protein